MAELDERLRRLFDLVLRKYRVNLRLVEGVASIESLTLLDYDRLEQANLAYAGNVDRRRQNQLLALDEVKTFLQHPETGFRIRQKLFNDPILGTFKVHPVALLIIDTPQFQRLRHISQLAALNYVYPGATGTRFEHSLGVYHLAGQLINTLRENQPELKITLIDCLCVELAGLCHDLGHGPFSHLFEGVVRQLDEIDRRVVPGLDRAPREWKHEEATNQMLEYLFTTNPQITTGFELWGFRQEDREFIKCLTRGQPNEALTGRNIRKRFLYDIVANEKNGMDVDKWDYISRDTSYLGVKTAFEYERLLLHLRVIYVGGRPQICVRDKEVDSVFSLFFSRYSLHKKAYQHPVGRCVELMLTDAIVKADPHLQIRGQTILQCIDDMEAYTRLNDGIFYKILDSESWELRDSRRILERLENRQLYKCIAQAKVTEEDEEFRAQLRDKLREATNEEFVVEYTIRHFGKKNQNPLDHIRFYKKSEPERAQALTDDQKLFSGQFQHKAIAAYCTSMDFDNGIYETVKRIFEVEGLNVIISHG